MPWNFSSPAILFFFKDPCCFVHLMFSFKEPSFTQLQKYKTRETKSYLGSFIFFSAALLVNVMDPKKTFFFQHCFSLSLNPFFLLGQYSPLSLLSLCLVHTQVFPSAHLCRISYSSTSPPPLQCYFFTKTAQFNWLACKENCQIYYLPSARLQGAVLA